MAVSLADRSSKNKTFFFVDYEGTKEYTANTALSTVATAAERRGDFANSFFNNQPTQIFDPATYNTATRTRLPFANRIIPANRIDPVAAKVGSFSVDPNRSSIINNYFSNPRSNANTHKGDLRIDHTINMGEDGALRLQQAGLLPAAGIEPPCPGIWRRGPGVQPE